MQLSKKLKMFSQLFAAFPKSAFIWNITKKRMSLIAYVFSKLYTAKNLLM